MGGRGFRISSFLVVLADDSGCRALPVWLPGPEGHGLFRGDGDHPHPERAEVITADLLGAGPGCQPVDGPARGPAQDLAGQFTRDVPLPSGVAACRLFPGMRSE
jgi:hypothetical protein